MTRFPPIWQACLRCGRNICKRVICPFLIRKGVNVMAIMPSRQKGEINPFSNKKEDFDKEMALIANGTRDMWMRDFANIYVDYGVNDAKYYGEKDGKHAAYYDQNYERARKIAYTIGGVDFTQYMDKDVEIPEAGKRRIMGGEKLAEELGLPKYDGKDEPAPVSEPVAARAGDERP